MVTQEQLAKRLKLLRTACNYRAIDVAERIGYHKETVSKSERAMSLPSIDYMARVCQLYGVSIDVVALGTDTEFSAMLAKKYEVVS